MQDELTQLFPRLMKLVGTKIIADLAKAESCRPTREPLDCLVEKRNANEFKSGLLTHYLCAALWGEKLFDPLVPQIEADLAKLEPRVANFDELISAFRDKLLNDKQFDDVVYEIAGAGIASDLLDDKTMSLEEPLSESTKKNPDVTGKLSGRPTKVEITVIHDDWPPSFNHEAMKIVESAAVGGGYTVHLHVPITDEKNAERIKALIEKLSAARLSIEPKVIVEGHEFDYHENEFHCKSVMCPIRYIEFHEFEHRFVQGGVFERSTMTRIEEEDLEEKFPQPKGTVTSANLPKNPVGYDSTPIGEKIYRTLEKKLLKQCQEGAINVVVLGLPQAHNDKGIDDALGGSGAAFYPILFTPDTPDEGIFARTGLGPFIDESSLPSEGQEEIRNVIDRFREISAVLVLRLDTVHPLARLIRNPNANQPLTDDECKRLRDLALDRARRRLDWKEVLGDLNSSPPYRQ